MEEFNTLMHKYVKMETTDSTADHCHKYTQQNLSDNILTVGVSGGPDSMVLLYLLNQWAKDSTSTGTLKESNTSRSHDPANITMKSQVSTFKVLAVTIDHGLRSEGKKEAAMVAKYCHEHNILHECIALDWQSTTLLNNDHRHVSMLAARRKRYKAIEGVCKKYNSRYVSYGVVM